MGYKDDRWRDAPGYCVDCGNLRPLNQSAVCQKCWGDLEIFGGAWQEDEDRSRVYRKVFGHSARGNAEIVEQVRATKPRYGVNRFDSRTFQVVDQFEQREICVCADYDESEDGGERAERIAALLNQAETMDSDGS